MPWTETCTVDQRVKFVNACAKGVFTVSELCVRFDISRKTGYKWLRRFREEGIAGLYDRSRAPKSCPHKTPPEVAQFIIDFIHAKRYRLKWGADKVRKAILRKHPDVAVPSTPTVARIMDEHGLVKHRPTRRRWQQPASVPLVTTAPNQVWCMDFKGEFRMGNGRKNYPLTVTDAYSAYYLCCHGLPSTASGPAQATVRRVFTEYGLPAAIRTDNGVPFVHMNAICGLSAFGVYLIKLGIIHQRIERGSPQQNARHERSHRELKRFAARPPAANFVLQQEAFDVFVYQFNFERPHQGLNDLCPIDLYHRSERPLPARLPKPTYPRHWEVRRVSGNGTCKLNNREVFITSVLAREDIGFEEIDEALWNVFFYDRLLARYDEKDQKLHAPSP